MPYMRFLLLPLLLFVCLVPPAMGQSSGWDFRHRFEIRAGYRDSQQERFQLRFAFPSDFLPVGQTNGFMETVDAGGNFELSVANVQLDARYGSWFHARAKVHAVDKHRRNPTSNDRTADIDELFVVVGDMPEFFERPEGTSLFLL
ncbi:MAG TPA: hypothetical protein VFT12_13435, partial [Thermoanaerobaculia bacterium]|nr:hypothetical protein [Thermoanaerobaculia bacterium]